MAKKKNSAEKKIEETIFCSADQSSFQENSFPCSIQKYVNELETLLTIQQAITSHLDLSDVLQMIADEARRLTSARLSFLFVSEEDYLILAAMSGSEDNTSIIGTHVPISQSLAGESILTGQPKILNNVQKDDPRIFSKLLQPFGEIGCYLTVPLIYRDHSIGVIAVADSCNSALKDESLRILSMLAPTAAIGIENARLYQAQQERRLEAEGRHQMSESLRVMLAIVNSNRSLDEILNYIVTHVGSRLFDCQGTAIFALNHKDSTLSVQAAYGLSYEFLDAQFLPGYSAAYQAIGNKQSVSVTNSQVGGSDDDPNLDLTTAEWAIASQMKVLYKAWLAVPLVVKGETYGAIVIYYDEPREFSHEEINMALIFSDQVALAIENARLRIQAEQAAVIAERNRLARELHDAVSQTLFSANLIAEVIPRLWDRNQQEARARLEELHQLTNGALAEMRTLLYELRPAVFKEAKLGDLLKHLTQGISVRSEIPIRLTVEGEKKLSAEVQIALYRITQEALNNIVKHANPQQANVFLSCQDKEVKLVISDDGCGFDPSTVSSEHFGLSIMRERATSINAAIQIISEPGSGTKVEVVCTNPTPEEKNDDN